MCSLMCRIKTLTSMAELRSSGFGQPAPRHGLRLLYWFVQNCVEVNRQTSKISLCISTTGNFGFRIFHNREERGKGHLLPDSSNLLYYELGNLSVFGAKSLPEYVREKYTGFQDKSNTDRIMVSLESGTFRSIYVTRHDSRMNFDPIHTFCVGPELVRTIKKMQREDFLRAAKRRRNPGPRRDTMLHTESELLTALSAPSHQPYSQDLHLHAATHLRLHLHKDTRNISICFSLLVLLTTALLLGFIRNRDVYSTHSTDNTDDAITATLHLFLTHLNNKDTYVRMLFIRLQFSIQHNHPSALSLLGLNTSLCNWILDFLTGRPQPVQIGNSISSTTTLSTGAPQGCVLSPLLFTLLTHDCA
ncbi:hypothetical protein QTP70_009361 [Hemibagrus guttatus]|uniref:Reverse transcriptase domain-containing protein n=1 Tax=Hemibagrus guttatus TaxID=175788 RepID=A0AAE0UIV8_9TELE|nr:hypothetical protein QTP70_009361 [Hemibagrus guttatus]